jgi:hypothetical protein
MDDYRLGGSLLQREGSTRKWSVRDDKKDQSIQEVIEDATKEIEQIFSKVKKKPEAQASAA